MPDRTILAFDTSAALVAAALLSDDRIVASRVVPMAKGQAEALFPLLDEMLCEAGIGMSDLDAIGVGIGPGNFTGIRISVAAARGLALSLGIPAVGVSALEALAYGTTGSVQAELTAPRGALYVQAFHNGQATAPPGMVPAEAPLPDAAKVSDGPDGPSADDRITAVARIAASRLGSAQPRPAPLYLRAADAAPPRDAAPAILP